MLAGPAVRAFAAILLWQAQEVAHLLPAVVLPALRPSQACSVLAPHAETLAEAAGVMKYAFASYGMLLFIFSKPG